MRHKLFVISQSFRKKVLDPDGCVFLYEVTPPDMNALDDDIAAKTQRIENRLIELQPDAVNVPDLVEEASQK